MACCVLTAFLLNNGIVPVRFACAQEILLLPQPGARINLSQTFNPSLLKGIKVHPDNPFKLDFILDKGDLKASTASLKAASTRLIKYFLASITVPEKDLWVNLSPYEKDRIIPDGFGVTEMGRDLLAQDYMLKQITASVIYPEENIGKEFWDKVYAEARKRFGTADVPVDTFNKVWIVPEKAVIYETKDAAYVVGSKLKVLLEEDYLALDKNVVVAGQITPATNKLGSDIIREVVIPILEKEVNQGKNFAQLRQVYHSLILAIWFKDKIKESIFGRSYVDRDKVAGVDIKDKSAKDKIWAQYVEAFKKGAYNYIKEDWDPTTQQTVPRKYFSGGAGLYRTRGVLSRSHDRAQLPQGVSDRILVIQSEFDFVDIVRHVDSAQDALAQEDRRQLQSGRRRLLELAKEHPKDSGYLHMLAAHLSSINLRKKTHMVHVVENAYRLINFNDNDVEYLFFHLKEVQAKGDSWSGAEKAERLAAYRKELSKVKALYEQLPSEYQRMLVPLAIFHDIGALSPEGDKRWRGQGIPDLDNHEVAYDWV